MSDKNKYFDIHKPVFWPAAILIVLFITVTIVVGDPIAEVFGSVQEALSDYGGWMFVLFINIFLFFGIFLGFSKLGKLRIGGKNATPEFSTGAWFAMLFSAGMGIGIIFWGVAEPMNHFINMPQPVPEAERGLQAMGFSFLHWGFHAWGVYALVGLSLAFFTYSKGYPLMIRSVFRPVFGKRTEGWIGDFIDILAVLSTLFGLATSLGLGVQQVSSGFNYLFNLPDTILTQVVLIGIITAIASVSVVLGVDKGVKRLSELNIILAALFLIFLIIVGPTLFFLESYMENIAYYIQHFFELSFWNEAYASPDRSGWQNSWTVFYWAWWISWSPFVGMFIARVSKGRTVREFILGVLLVPSLLTFLWMTVFGGSGIWLELSGTPIGDNIVNNLSTSLFLLLEQFPLAAISSGIGVLLVINFFVTSSDSGSLVIDSITAGGKLNTPVAQRVFWAVIEGTVAAALLVGGGLTALQTAAVSTGLPFALVLLVMMYSLYKGLSWEAAKEDVRDKENDLETYEKRLRQVIRKRTKEKQNQ